MFTDVMFNSRNSVLSDKQVGTTWGLHMGSSLLRRGWNSIRGAVRFVVSHPLQAMTVGLMAQPRLLGALGQDVHLSTNNQVGFILRGAAAYDESGHSVASVGDLNGDGLADFIIGAPGADHDRESGVSYVIFGHKGAWTSPFDLSTLNGTNGFNLTGVAVGDWSGGSVAGAGDVNGDGMDDLMIGVPNSNDYAGTTYVVFGHPGSWNSSLSLATLDGSNGFALTGISSGDRSGYSVDTAGDVNGDGISDLIVGAPDANNSRGTTYVVFGHPGSWNSSLSLATLDGSNGFALKGVASGDRSGAAVSTVADVNGDGIADFMIGAYGVNHLAGASYVVFGHKGTWINPFNLSTLNGTNGLMLSGVTAYDESGVFVSAAGDVNGDGIGDLMVGSTRANNFTGASYVVFGHHGSWSNPLSLSTLNGTNGFTLTGITEGDQSGVVGTAGDVNGDGISDLIVGAHGANRGNTGVSYVIFGHKEAWDSPWSLSRLNGSNGFNLRGGNVHDASGYSVGSAGDVNGDGIADFIIGGQEANNFAGATYVVFGHAGAWANSLDLSTLNGTNTFTSADILREASSEKILDAMGRRLKALKNKSTILEVLGTETQQPLIFGKREGERASGMPFESPMAARLRLSGTRP